ncbi:putative glucosyltransferase [Thozetella sp. PMI_491]|nr:putative glucosyltransferase [Thozetella sp. PMI_491]
MMSLLADICAILAVIGVIQALFGWLVVFRYSRLPPAVPATRPGITVLRPMCGLEPDLEKALVSCFAMDYPDYQLVFGFQDPNDPAQAVLERVRARFPSRDVAVVVDSTPHGQNPKVANLANMLPSARHDILVISDSDIHVPTDYLDSLVAELQKPGIGMVCSLYVGMVPEAGNLFQRLGAMQITHAFLPGVLMGWAMNRRDCLGSTTMVAREVLDRTGGLAPLFNVLAEDNMMGRGVLKLGLDIRLSHAVTAATVPEDSLRSLWQHEIRWTRTIRGLVPYNLAASTLQYPLFWALLAVLGSGASGWSVILFLLCWLVRALVAGRIEAALRLRSHLRGLMQPAPLWAFPIRDLLSVIEIVASYGIENVVWRGHILYANGGSRP